VDLDMNADIANNSTNINIYTPNNNWEDPGPEKKKWYLISKREINFYFCMKMID
jgi:hypothetical protein